MTAVAALAGFAAAGLLVALCVVATLPHRPLGTWAVTAVLGAAAGLVGGLAGALVLDVHPTAFFSPAAWAPAIAVAAVLLALWRAVAPPRV